MIHASTLLTIGNSYGTLLVCFYLLFSCQNSNTINYSSTLQTSNPPRSVEADSMPTPSTDTCLPIPKTLNALIKAYPSQQLKACGQQLIWPDGEQWQYNSSDSSRSFEAKLAQSTLADHFSIPYPKGMTYDTPTVNQDPGRLRFQPLLERMYGANKKAVQANLVRVDFFGSSIYVSQINGVDQQLKAIIKELQTTLKKHPELLPYLQQAGGGFNWRYIAGTQRLSAHSFGIAIDIGTKAAHYWRWATRAKDTTVDIPYQNRIPMEIVRIFEAHGFIWGGKWYHYDTMHFEYRPELLL